MSENKKPDDCSSKSPPPENRVVSLCDRRRRLAIEIYTEELITHLEAIHRTAIEVHNQTIDRAELSVLTEFCRTAGLCFDLLGPNSRAAVVTPAALYGNSGGAVFGKRPLQERITDAVSAADGEEASRVLKRLNTAHPAVWDYQPGLDEPTGLAVPLAGPNSQMPLDVAGIIVKSGQLSREPGVYSGWKLSYRGIDFIVFGHRLDRSREVAVRNLLASREDRADEEIWRRIELPLLRAIVDPENHHHRRDRNSAPHLTNWGVRQPASRRGLLLSIRRTLWRHFAEPATGLTIHAHIAALFNDAQSREAFLDEIREISATVTIKSGGLREDEEPLTLDEILSPFFVRGDGRELRLGDLKSHPLSVLLLDDTLLEASGLHRTSIIADALAWTKAHCGSCTADSIESAWMTYRTEQNLAAAYGLAIGLPPVDTTGTLAFARRSAVLPNIRTLFDPRFMTHSLADLDLAPEHEKRLAQGLSEYGTDLQGYTLDDISRDERRLTHLRSVSHPTCNAVRQALLELASRWRWQRVDARLR